MSSSLVQQSEEADIEAAEIVEDEYSKDFALVEQASAGEANDITRRALIEHVSAGTTEDNQHASVVDRLTGNLHSLSIASREQALTGDVTLAGVPIPMDILFEKDVWIADTGASNHGTYNDLGGTDVQISTSSNLGIHGSAVKVEKTINISGQFVEKNGNQGLKATLTAVNYTPGSNFNVISVTRLLMQGWSIAEGNANRIILQSSTGEQINFDIVVKTAKGAIFATRFIRDVEVTGVSTESGTKMSINRAHSLLGHGDENSTKSSAKQLGCVITRGKLKPCEHCVCSKTKQKNVSKESVAEKSKRPCERVYLDLSKIIVPHSDGILSQQLVRRTGG